MTTFVAARLLEMGYTTERIREAIPAVRRNIGHSELTVTDVVAWLVADDDTVPAEPAPIQTAGTCVPRRLQEESVPQRRALPTHVSSNSLTINTRTSNDEGQETTFEIEGAVGGCEDQQKIGHPRRDRNSHKRTRTSPPDTMAQNRKGKHTMKEENKFLKQMLVCKICKDKYVCVTFLPCGHLVCCENCAQNMRKCPICRKIIKGQVRTFMS